MRLNFFLWACIITIQDVINYRFEYVIEMTSKPASHADDDQITMSF